MTVLDNTPRDQYTATGGQVAFSYTFEIAAEGDIAVLQNGVLLSLGAGAGEYAVTGVGSDTGGVVTLVTGATSGDIITLYRDMALERLTSYTNGGDFLAADVNNDYDRLWLALQQNTGTSNRALVAPNTDPIDINMTIPGKTARLGKYLKFNDTTGNPEAGSIAGAFTAAGMNHYNFTGDGATVNFTLGMEPGGENNTQVYIDGVYQQKNTYNVSGAVVQFSAAPPNLSTIEVMVVQVLPVGATTASQVSFTQAGSTTARNVQLKLQESVSVKDFGAVGDGVTDDTAAIQAAINTASSVLFPSGTYKVLSTITLTSNLILKGDGGIVDASSIADGFVATGKSDVTVQNMEFILDTDANGGLFTIDGCHRVNFVNNYFRAEDDDDTGNNSAIRIREEVGVSGSRDVIITNNFFVGPRLLVLVQAGATYNNKNVVISNNVFKNDCVAVRSPNILDGIVKIDLWSDDVTVSGNVCDGDQKVESFIQIEEGITNCTVTGNTIKDCTEYGINISGGQGPLDVTEVSITGNTLKNCSLGVEGLHTNSGEWIISNNVISGASIDASTPGIDLEFANAGANVIISNNLVNSPAEEGIYCKADGATITGNNVTGATGVSIYVYDADNSSVIGNNVSQSNNTPYPIYIRSSDLCNIVGNSVKGAATVTSGIAFVGCSGGFAQGNYVSMANSTYGILVDGTSSDISVLSNSASVSTQALSVPVAANHRFGNIDIGAAVHSVADIGGEFIWADSAGNLRIKGSSPVSDTDGTVVGTQT